MSYYSPTHRSPRGGRGGRPFNSFQRPDKDAPRPGDRQLLEGLQSVPLQTLATVTKHAGDKEVKITGLEYIGSYNWVNKEVPTVIVPGSPPRWRNRATPYQVQPDVGTVFRDQNGYRVPKAVLLPLFTAVDFLADKGDIAAPKVDWSSVDFVTDRNNLRKLLRWIIGGDVKDFRIDTQLAGKTVLLNRWESRYREEMPGYTFGFNFEKESTVPANGCETSTGHHRILIYDLNGLKMVVRHEVDACIPTDTPSTLASKETTKPATADVDDLIGALSSVKLEDKKQDKKTKVPSTDEVPGSTVTVIPAGVLVPQSSIVELTTRSMKNSQNFDWKESYGQLWLSQTPHHFLARHERGRFTEVQKRKLTSMEMKEIVSSLGTIKDEQIKLRRLLDVIKQIVSQYGEQGRLSLVCQGGKLEVYERINKESCLPENILRRFV